MRIACIAGVVIGLGACTMETPSKEVESRLEITEMIVDRNLTAGTPYPVYLLPNSSNGGVEMLETCFLWNTEGPYCFPFKRERRNGPEYVRTDLVTGTPNTYALTAFVKYRSSNGVEAESNRLAKQIVVSK